MDYAKFLDDKTHSANDFGFAPIVVPDALYDFQKHLLDWSLRRGRAAVFADCGLGKTPLQLAWAENVVRKENKPVLIIAPLAVSAQTVREGEKFGIECHRSRDGKIKDGINITNYEQLHRFNTADFVGVACDESSIIKHFSGATQLAVTEFMRKTPYRSLWTATAAPNDYIELGTSSEVLGQLGHMDMLNRFFKNDLHNSASGRYHGEVIKWRFKGHAELPFWKWVCSWARAIRKPSDLGFEDRRFVLPRLIEEEHLIEDIEPADGFLFQLPAVGLAEQRQERRRTVEDRCEKVASLVNGTGKPALVWCHLNDEGDLLEELMPDCVQVAGSDSDDSKEERLLAFSNGQARVLVTKQKIAGWGMNWQHCAHVACFPSHSFEQFYQSIRRCWRFGQKNPVKVDIITTEGEKNIMRNLRRKSEQADKMFFHLIEEMNKAIGIKTGTAFDKKEEVPSWL